MTKRELIAALAAYDDDQYVFVNLHSKDYPNGSQVIIQGVRACEPWKGGKPLIGLRAHVQNAELMPDGTIRNWQLIAGPIVYESVFLETFPAEEAVIPLITKAGQ